MLLLIQRYALQSIGLTLCNKEGFFCIEETFLHRDISTSVQCAFSYFADVLSLPVCLLLSSIAIHFLRSRYYSEETGFK